MAKVIKASEAAVVDAVKMVDIQHTKVMKDAAGKDVTVVDWTETVAADEMITRAEADLVAAEALVVSLKADIVEYKKIKG